jgi:hypothetical protein
VIARRAPAEEESDRADRGTGTLAIGRMRLCAAVAIAPTSNDRVVA